MIFFYKKGLKLIIDIPLQASPHVALVCSALHGVWRLRGKVKQIIKVHRPKIHPSCFNVSTRSHSNDSLEEDSVHLSSLTMVA